MANLNFPSQFTLISDETVTGSRVLMVDNPMDENQGWKLELSQLLEWINKKNSTGQWSDEINNSGTNPNLEIAYCKVRDMGNVSEMILTFAVSGTHAEGMFKGVKLMDNNDTYATLLLDGANDNVLWARFSQRGNDLEIIMQYINGEGYGDVDTQKILFPK